MRVRPAIVVALASALACARLAGQTAKQGQDSQPSDPVAAAGERWLASDHTSREELDATVKVLMQRPAAGIAWLAQQLPAALATHAAPRAKGVQSLVTHCTLEFLRQQRARGMTYVGQYDPLAPLQPAVGDLLFDLLLATPEWYPHTFRVRLVAPLRDLQPRLPSPARVEAVLQIVENDRIEPEDLRRALATLLWRWGNKAPAQKVVAELSAATAEGDAEDRVQTTLDLADFWCQLREYEQSAKTHRSAQALAKGAGVALRPVAWYAAACVHALAGDVERGIAAFAECAKLLDSPDLDSSLRLARSLFEQDPELEPLRHHARWPQLLQRAGAHAPAEPRPVTEPRPGR